MDRKTGKSQVKEKVTNFILVLFYSIKGIKKLFLSKFIYKYFPKLFLWLRFSSYKNINTEEYWSRAHSHELVKKTKRFDHFVLSLLPQVCFSGKDVLDVGCGQGIFLSQLKNAKSLTGVDISEKAINIIKKKGMRGLVRSLPKLNLKQKYDIISCFETLEHVEKWKQSIDKMIKYLRPNGYLLISVPFENSIVMNEHVTYFDINRLYNFLKKKLFILEIKIIKPWFLTIAINKKYKRGEIPEYFLNLPELRN